MHRSIGHGNLKGRRLLLSSEPMQIYCLCTEGFREAHHFPVGFLANASWFLICAALSGYSTWVYGYGSGTEFPKRVAHTRRPVVLRVDDVGVAQV